jgi:hypothetical protein
VVEVVEYVDLADGNLRATKAIERTAVRPIPIQIFYFDWPTVM